MNATTVSGCSCNVTGRPYLSTSTYHLPVACLYLITLLVSLIQILRIIFHRHNIFHYQFVFLAFCFFWGAIRVAFLPFVNWAEHTEVIFNGIAIIIQFATFSFVVLFYAQMVHRSNSRNLSQIALIIYLIINIIVVGLFIGISFYKNVTELDVVHSIFHGCAYVLLTISISIYGWRLKSLIFDKVVKVPFLKNLRALFILTTVLTIIFFFRAIWNFILAYENINPKIHVIPVILIACPCPTNIQQIITVIVMLIWEVIPCYIMLLIFWKIPKAKRIKPFHDVQPNMFISYRPMGTSINASSAETIGLLDSLVS